MGAVEERLATIANLEKFRIGTGKNARELAANHFSTHLFTTVNTLIRFNLQLSREDRTCHSSSHPHAIVTEQMDKKM